MDYLCQCILLTYACSFLVLLLHELLIAALLISDHQTYATDIPINMSRGPGYGLECLNDT